MATLKNAFIMTDFYKEAFKEYDVPDDIQRAAIRICNAYEIKGICDPMYITNVIADCIGRADEIKVIKH